MSDNFYTMELMAREKARRVRAEMQRRQMRARAPQSDLGGPGSVLWHYPGDVPVRAGRFLQRRARVVAG
jgi:hypothetical protein